MLSASRLLYPGSRVFFFFFMRAQEASVLADKSSVKSRSYERCMKGLWHPRYRPPAFRLKLRKETGKKVHLSTFWPSLFGQYRLNDHAEFSSIFLLPAILTASI